MLLWDGSCELVESRWVPEAELVQCAGSPLEQEISLSYYQRTKFRISGVVSLWSDWYSNINDLRNSMTYKRDWTKKEAIVTHPFYKMDRKCYSSIDVMMVNIAKNISDQLRMSFIDDYKVIWRFMSARWSCYEKCFHAMSHTIDSFGVFQVWFMSSEPAVQNRCLGVANCRNRQRFLPQG